MGLGKVFGHCRACTKGLLVLGAISSCIWCLRLAATQSGGFARRTTHHVAAFASKAVCHCLHNGNELNECEACKQTDVRMPAMLCVPNDITESTHRAKNAMGMFHNLSAAVPLPVSRHDMRAYAHSMKAMAKELTRLRSKGVWDETVVK